MLTDDQINEMMVYYDERAEEYDEIYGGKGHISIAAAAYIKDTAQVSALAARFGRGHLIDIGCGPAFWCPSYARNCSRITFLDQSHRMLLKCKERVEALGLAGISSFIQGDFLDVGLEPRQYECALAGFLLSHLTLEQEKIFFGKLEKILKPAAQLMVIDSVWNARRQQYQAKEGIQERILNDGRTFRVYKRYFDQSDVDEMLTRYNFAAIAWYTGEAFIAAIAESLSPTDY